MLYNKSNKQNEMDEMVNQITGVSAKQVQYAESLLKQSLDFLGASQEKYEKLMAKLIKENVEKFMQMKNLTKNEAMVEILAPYNLSGYYVRANVTNAKEIIDLLK